MWGQRSVSTHPPADRSGLVPRFSRDTWSCGHPSVSPGVDGLPCGTFRRVSQIPAPLCAPTAASHRGATPPGRCPRRSGRKVVPPGHLTALPDLSGVACPLLAGAPASVGLLAPSDHCERGCPSCLTGVGSSLDVFPNRAGHLCCSPEPRGPSRTGTAFLSTCTPASPRAQETGLQGRAPLSVCLSPQGEERLRILVEAEGEGLPLMDMSTCEVSPCSGSSQARALPLSHAPRRPSPALPTAGPTPPSSTRRTPTCGIMSLWLTTPP